MDIEPGYVYQKRFNYVRKHSNERRSPTLVTGMTPTIIRDGDRKVGNSLLLSVSVSKDLKTLNSLTSQRLSCTNKQGTLLVSLWLKQLLIKCGKYFLKTWKMSNCAEVLDDYQFMTMDTPIVFPVIPMNPEIRDTHHYDQLEWKITLSGSTWGSEKRNYQRTHALSTESTEMEITLSSTIMTPGTTTGSKV